MKMKLINLNSFVSSIEDNVIYYCYADEDGTLNVIDPCEDYVSHVLKSQADWFPTYIMICTRCKGKGSIGNPAFNGTSVDWWIEKDGDTDGLNEYLHGDTYDVPCDYECDQGKAMGIDWNRLAEVASYEDTDMLERMSQLIHDIDKWRDMLLEDASERSMSSYGLGL